ncbi:hypothetical protein [Algiphilus sp.]|uniref:hypothetical protein n=1 Tax=Algiphilus sp. TaxID=1872431 RepID=UPI003B52307B
MHGQRQDAAAEAVLFRTPDDAGPGEEAGPFVELDAHGQMLTVNGGRQSYASLFSADACAEGRPEELLRLARRHGLVRDCVLRRDAGGIARQQRIALQALRDAQGNLVGFREFQLR